MSDRVQVVSDVAAALDAYLDALWTALRRHARRCSRTVTVTYRGELVTLMVRDAMDVNLVNVVGNEQFVLEHACRTLNIPPEG